MPLNVGSSSGSGDDAAQVFFDITVGGDGDADDDGIPDVYQRETVDDRADHRPRWEGAPKPGRTVDEAVHQHRDGDTPHPPYRTVDDDAEHRLADDRRTPPGRTVGPSADG